MGPMAMVEKELSHHFAVIQTCAITTAILIIEPPKPIEKMPRETYYQQVK